MNLLRLYTSVFITASVVSSFSPVNLQATKAKSSTKLKSALPAPDLAARAAAALASSIVGGTVGVKFILDRPTRKFEDGSVAREYDAWGKDGILEYYWGEHIHLGYYGPLHVQKRGFKKNFIQAKKDLIDAMLNFAGIYYFFEQGDKVLDVGCGVGGTSRSLAKALGPKADVTGITLSPYEAEHATELAEKQGVPNTKFKVMNALEMDFPDNSFDIVWACESGKHMPDKQKYIEEMMRVLKPGGKFIMSTWCQRDDSEVPFTKKEQRDLKFMYEAWTHPSFTSIENYRKLIENTGVMTDIVTVDWATEVLPSFRHSIMMGAYDPRGWVAKPHLYFKCLRDNYALLRVNRAFKRGLMRYGVFTATKKSD